MQTVLITGANGFVGYYLTQQLLQKSYRVIATGKGPGRLNFKEPGFFYEPLDFTLEENIKSILQQYQPDFIVHAGAISKPDDCELNKVNAYEVNVKGSRLLLKHAAAFKSFFIFLSSDFVFSGEEKIYREEDETGPVNYYGQTKCLAEAAIKSYAYPWSIVRPVLVYGYPATGRQNILTNVAAALQRGDELRIFTDQLRTPTYVEDLASALVTIIERRSQGIYHIAGSDRLSPYDMACAVADHLRLDKSFIHPVTAQTFQQPALRPPATLFDITKAKELLNYHPTSFAEGLRKTFILK